MNTLKSKYAQLLAGFNNNKKSLWGSSSPAQAGAANLTSEIVNLILTEAISSRTSDIHIEPRNNHVFVRYRIDGKLYEMLDIEEGPNVNVLPRLKILANIPTDSASSRKAWDGRFSMEVLSKKYDFRVATFPTILGDKIAIRILSKDAEIVDLKRIGLSPADQARIERIVQRKSGLVVVSGPTGGGKTTTLYSLLKRLHTPSVNIVTMEDPVEYQIDGINQCDVKNKGDEDFISGLKAVLRQDPDVLLIGEIRDKESAEIAIRASITGHLVLTSLHANSAFGTVMRLVNMGVAEHMVAYALIGAVAQRLVRKICDNCRVPQKVDAVTLERICESSGINPKLFSRVSSGAEGGLQYVAGGESAGDVMFYKGSGCEQCAGTGYRGRIGVYEIAQFTDEIRDAILRKLPVKEIERMATENGFQTLAMDAIHKVKSGVVSLDDIYPILLEKSS